jgi:hypothetical protein
MGRTARSACFSLPTLGVSADREFHAGGYDEGMHPVRLFAVAVMCLVFVAVWVTISIQAGAPFLSVALPFLVGLLPIFTMTRLARRFGDKESDALSEDERRQNRPLLAFVVLVGVGVLVYLLSLVF